MPIYIDPTAIIIGDVRLADGVSVWPYAVLRGDEGHIVVGEGSNIQDHVMLHVGPGFPTIIGKDCTVGHGAVINGAEIGDRCIVGMNSSIVEGAVLGEECVIGAGSVITGKTVIPAGSLVVGVPGKVVKQLSPEQMKYPEANCEEYVELSRKYLEARR